MKIVVCDDDEKFLKEFKTVLQERLTSLEIEAELTMYSTGKKLVEVCEQEEIDVLFLDIDMPEVDGFKIAESVRKKELNCLIVFCSNYSDFVFKSFRYEPFSFLCKENYQEQLSDVMKRIYEKWNSRKKEFTYQIKGGGVRIKQRDILYGQWGARGYDNLAPGDAIFFDWDLDGSADHVGIVIGTDGSRVYTVEGNSGDACKIKSYDLNYECIFNGPYK